ncbi:hypothetical protein CXP39_01335 [Mesoplasma syrphidae]|uniref:Arabinogalactan endo-beta-1,4-galactanase n=1 Tax=Mesoplasma syrphidae TaxID=225999 RepID=A0A2K9C8U9_9MOLU|nr:glycosyl hydrolase 53 family protein [Mesoplasma syrphidae]AUF83445.1 hypothetical protein CXP39_01335 [Mesoplasma syrphidae]
MKNIKLKPLMISIFILLTSFLATFASSCTPSSLREDFPANGKIITNEKFIKGVDVSSYAEIIEQSTLDNGEVKSYSNLTDDEQKIYYNFAGEKENLFKILADNGANSIRLRVWNDPYENGQTYGGGHNDIDTNIWIANQAKKNGINDVLLNFHYSDFWADPSRQWLPKKWVDITNEKELENGIYQYTLDSLIKFEKETGIIPSKVQIGNEITNGSFWNWKRSNTQYKNYQYTSRLLKKGLEAVEDFALSKKAKISKSIHIDGSITLKRWKQLLHIYLIEGDLINLVDGIAITHHPDWNGNSKTLYDVMSLIKREYNLPSFVSETAAVSTFDETNLAGDITTSQHNPNSYYNIPDAATQMILINSMMEASSQALPDNETGIYWWEPAWILSNNSGWATRKGIIYSEPLDEQKQKDFKTGNSWWNSGIFTNQAKPLPVLKVIKNYERINQSKDNLNWHQITNKSIFKNFNKDPVLEFSKIAGFKNKLDINDWIDDHNLLIYDYSTEADIYKAFLKLNPRILEKHITYENIVWDQNKEAGKLKIKNAKTNTVYKPFELSIDFKILDYEENTYRITEPIEIGRNDTNWLSKIVEAVPNKKETIKQGETEIDSFIYESIRPEFYKNEYYSWAGKSNNALVFYDDKNGENRFLDTKILKNNNTKIFKNKKVDYSYLAKNSQAWQNVLSIGEYEISLVFTKRIEFENFGLENWKELGGFAIKAKVKVI